MENAKRKRFMEFNNIPEYGAIALVSGSNESRAVIRTAYGETFKASSTMGPCFAMEAAMKKWRESEDEKLKQLRGF